MSFTKGNGADAMVAFAEIESRLSATAKTALAGPLRDVREFLSAAIDAAPSDIDVRRERWKQEAKAADALRTRRSRKPKVDKATSSDDSPTIFEAE